MRKKNIFVIKSETNLMEHLTQFSISKNSKEEEEEEMNYFVVTPLLKNIVAQGLCESIKNLTHGESI